MNQPSINVTPLIDVLLVLLIIFMVVAPIKPSSFKARIPQEPRNDAGQPNDHTLVAIVQNDGSLTLNSEKNLGTVADPARLIDRLKFVFNERISTGDMAENVDGDRPYSDRIERTVFVKAPRGAQYGEVARLIDAVKLAGAYPISLQIDCLDK